MPAVIKSTEAAGIAVVDEAPQFAQRRSVALAVNHPLGDAEAGRPRPRLTKVRRPP